MSSAREKFDQNVSDAYLSILRKIAEDPPSDAVLTPSLVSRIQAFLQDSSPKTPARVWNIYKEILDLTIYSALGSEFLVGLLNLEPFLITPEDAFSHENGNMAQAPWRKNLKG